MKEYNGKGIEGLLQLYLVMKALRGATYALSLLLLEDPMLIVHAHGPVETREALGECKPRETIFPFTLFTAHHYIPEEEIRHSSRAPKSFSYCQGNTSISFGL